MSHKYDQPMIVQEFIAGYEVEVPIIIHKQKSYALPPIILYQKDNFMLDKHFLDFDDIYDDNYCFCLLETINPIWAKNIQNEVTKIVSILGLEKYTRIDFRMSRNGTSFVTDINSYPHIVAHSSFAYAFQAIGFSAQDILPSIIGNII